MPDNAKAAAVRFCELLWDHLIKDIPRYSSRRSPIDDDPDLVTTEICYQSVLDAYQRLSREHKDAIAYHWNRLVAGLDSSNEMHDEAIRCYESIASRLVRGQVQEMTALLLADTEQRKALPSPPAAAALAPRAENQPPGAQPGQGASVEQTSPPSELSAVSAQGAEAARSIAASRRRRWAAGAAVTVAAVSVLWLLARPQPERAPSAPAAPAATTTAVSTSPPNPDTTAPAPAPVAVAAEPAPVAVAAEPTPVAVAAEPAVDEPAAEIEIPVLTADPSVAAASGRGDQASPGLGMDPAPGAPRPARPASANPADPDHADDDSAETSVAAPQVAIRERDPGLGGDRRPPNDAEGTVRSESAELAELGAGEVLVITSEHFAPLRIALDGSARRWPMPTVGQRRIEVSVGGTRLRVPVRDESGRQVTLSIELEPR